MTEHFWIMVQNGQAEDLLSLQVLEWQRDRKLDVMGQVYLDGVNYVERIANRLSNGNRYLFEAVCERMNDKMLNLMEQYSGKEGAEFTTYLNTTTRLTMFEILRETEKQKNRLPRLAERNKTVQQTPLAGLLFDELERNVAAALEKLPEENRTAWQLCFEDLDTKIPYVKVASALSCTPGAVKCRMFRTRDYLRRCIDEYLHAA